MFCRQSDIFGKLKLFFVTYRTYSARHVSLPYCQLIFLRNVTISRYLLYISILCIEKLKWLEKSLYEKPLNVGTWNNYNMGLRCRWVKTNVSCSNNVYVTRIYIVRVILKNDVKLLTIMYYYTIILLPILLYARARFHGVHYLCARACVIKYNM